MKPLKGRWVVMAILAIGLFAVGILYFGSLWIGSRHGATPAVSARQTPLG